MKTALQLTVEGSGRRSRLKGPFAVEIKWEELIRFVFKRVEFHQVQVSVL